MTTELATRTEPFLKWAGGKRWLAPGLAALLDAPSGRYIEPFVGGGSVFFALAPERAVLADSNSDLICAFRAVRDCPNDVIKRLRKLPVDRKTFNRIRRLRPDDPCETAARLIYLNRTAFNGLFRVNRRGEFNVPFGCKEGTTSCDASAIEKCSEALSSAELECGDYATTLKGLRRGDRVYLDPPYTVKHSNNGFRRYNETIFSWENQTHLAEIATKLAGRGVHIVVTNADHPEVRLLYPPDVFVGVQLERWSRMAATIEHRSRASELLFVSRHSIGDARTLRAKLNSVGVAYARTVRGWA